MLVDSPSLLIADDDAGFRETLRDVLAPRGYRTLLASDGEEALRIVRSEIVHLMLLDFHMPHCTGLELARTVRDSRFAIPWILLSAGLDDTIVREARAADVFYVLAKPFRKAQLTTVVADALRDRYDWAV
jgi:CheY-like chemotaxis protein